MSDLLFNDQEAEQRRLDLAQREPSHQFDWGYLGERAYEGFGSASARLAEGIIGPALRGVSQAALDGFDIPVGTAPGRPANGSIPINRGGRENLDPEWRTFWEGIEQRAEDGIEQARRDRRVLEAGDPARQSWASDAIFGLSQMIPLGIAGTVGGGIAGCAAVLGTSYGVPSYSDFIDDGMDAETARNAAVIEGVSMGILGALPVA